MDILADPARNRFYVLRQDKNQVLVFDGSTYNGSNARGIFTPGTGIRSVLSGTTYGWDMITRQGQAVASGLYLWSVRDKRTGARQTGKVLIIKSDRENF